MDSIDPAATTSEQREFARIDVVFQASLQPVDEQTADRLREEIDLRPSVWMLSDEFNLRDLAQGASPGQTPMLAQAILELCSQIAGLRSRILDSAGPVKPATILQLSGGGGRLRCDLGLEEGDRFEIRFADGENDVPPIRALAQVVHRPRQAGDGIGFCFEAMHPRDQELLMRTIYRLQREALRRAQRRDES